MIIFGLHCRLLFPSYFRSSQLYTVCTNAFCWTVDRKPMKNDLTEDYETIQFVFGHAAVVVLSKDTDSLLGHLAA